MAVSRKYDRLFRRYGRKIPVAFLRSLAKWESSMNPKESKGGAWGLLQVVPIVRTGYNKRYGTTYSRTDLLDPVVNIKIVAASLRRIIAGWKRNHPLTHPPLYPTRNLHENWSNPEFIKLLVHGWNAGYSEVGGVGKVASYIEKRDPSIGITLDTVGFYAPAAHAHYTLRGDLGRRKRVWAKKVARTYAAEAKLKPATPARPRPRPKIDRRRRRRRRVGSGPVAAALLALLMIPLVRLGAAESKRRRLRG